MELKGTTVTVSGGASGLGWAVTQHFQQAEAKVAVFDLPNDQNQKKVEALGASVAFCPVDVTQTDQVKNALEEIKTKFGPIQVAINCAGIASAAKTLKKGEPYPLEIFQRTLEVNLIGTFNMCRLAAAAMASNEPNEQGERGVLINTASVAAFEGQMGQTAYAASKGGIVALTLPLARDLAYYGIRVVTIAPGIFDTPMLALLPEEARQSLGQQVPFPKRLGDPKEFALLAQQIVINPMLNGEVIRLDGALRMGVK